MSTFNQTIDQTTYFTAQYNTRANAALAEATLARWGKQGAAARRTQACVLDLPCGDPATGSPRERIDFFPAAQANAPLLVFIHGGWWRFLSKSEFSWVARDFVKAGFNVALTDYDLCPHVSLHTIVLQQLRALAYLYRQAQALEFDATRIHIAGHSAGGHLGAMMACADWRLYAPDLPRDLLKTATLISGLYDLAPLRHVPSAQADLRFSEADCQHLSPLMYRPSSIPALAFAGGAESDEFARQSAELRRHWGKNAQALPAENLTHFTVMDEWASAGSAVHQGALALMHSV